MNLASLLEEIDRPVLVEIRGVQFELVMPNAATVREIMDDLRELKEENSVEATMETIPRKLLTACLKLDGDEKPNDEQLDKIIAFGGGFLGDLVYKCAEMCGLSSIYDSFRKAGGEEEVAPKQE